MQNQLVVKHLGRQDYEPIWQAMHNFTDARTDNTIDEVWIVEAQSSIYARTSW